MFNFGVGGNGFPAVQVKSERSLPNEAIKKKTQSGRTQTISAAAELLVFYLRGVIYFKNVEDKGKIYPFGMSKEGSGTDTQFITCRLIEVWGDELRHWSTRSPQLLQTHTTTEQS